MTDDLVRIRNVGVDFGGPKPILAGVSAGLARGK